MSKHIEEAAAASRGQFGFWLYLMTDCVLFASLFASYAVLRTSTNNGPGGAELFDLPFVLIETLLLLTSSLTCGLALIAARHRKTARAVRLLAATFILGAVFVGMELFEFRMLVHEGASWRESGFLSAYFTLVATHGLHILIGLIWLLTLLIHILRRGMTNATLHRFNMFSMFWHFLDVIWIFIFSIVYLWGSRL